MIKTAITLFLLKKSDFEAHEVRKSKMDLQEDRFGTCKKLIFTCSYELLVPIRKLRGPRDKAIVLV